MFDITNTIETAPHLHPWFSFGEHDGIEREAEIAIELLDEWRTTSPKLSDVRGVAVRYIEDSETFEVVATSDDPLSDEAATELRVLWEAAKLLALFERAQESEGEWVGALRLGPLDADLAPVVTKMINDSAPLVDIARVLARVA